jgi:hypothetical protein
VNAVSPLAWTRMVADTAAFMEANRVGMIDIERTPEPSANAPLVAYLLSNAARDICGQVSRIEGPQLSLVAHPVVLDPIIVTDQAWTLESIAAASQNVLAERQVPVGAEHMLKAVVLPPIRLIEFFGTDGGACPGNPGAYGCVRQAGVSRRNLPVIPALARLWSSRRTDD